MQGKRYAPRSEPLPAEALNPDNGGNAHNGDKGAKPAWVPHPNSLAALAAHRNRWADNRRCEKCKRVAISDRRFCFVHLGGGAKNRPPPSPDRAASREVMRRRRAGLDPALIKHDVFQRAAWGPQRLKPHALALIRAWDNRDNDPLAWANAVRNARAALEA